MGALKAYAPRDNKYVEAKNKLVNNVKNFYKGREKIIEGFKNGVFPFYYDEDDEERMKFEKEEEKESEENKFFKYIENKSKGISYDLFRRHFNFETPTQLTKKLFEIKDKNKNKNFVEEIKNRWSKLNDEIEKMFEDEKKLRSQIKY